MARDKITHFFTYFQNSAGLYWDREVLSTFKTGCLQIVIIDIPVPRKNMLMVLALWSGKVYVRWLKWSAVWRYIFMEMTWKIYLFVQRLRSSRCWRHYLSKLWCRDYIKRGRSALSLLRWLYQKWFLWLADRRIFSLSKSESECILL